MSGIASSVDTIKEFLSVLTWIKLLQLVTFLFIIGLAWATYENKELIYGYASQKRIDPETHHVHKLSEKTTAEIQTVINKSELIIGVGVFIADFQRNVRVKIYQSLDVPELAQIYSKFTDNKVSELPLFTDDVANNKHIVSLINGEFICRPFHDTLISKFVPQAATYEKMICTSGIPASYGRFTGIIAIYLNRVATPDEIDQLRSLGRTMATSIFDRDLSNH